MAVQVVERIWVVNPWLVESLSDLIYKYRFDVIQQMV